MSTLSVSNITDGTTTVGTSYVVNGSAKVWCSFDGTASTLSLEDSLNTSSLTDNGTGNQDFNFTNNMNNIYYYCNADCNATRIANAEGRQVSKATVRIANSSGTAQDRTGTKAIVVGDLA